MAAIGGGAGSYGNLPFKSEPRRRQARTVSLICEEEPLSEVQIKSFQTRLQEYRTFLEAVTRLASAGNICTTEECVAIGENGLLTGEALNALQHAGAISVYNTLQQNNWSFPLPENSEVVLAKRVTSAADDFLDNSDGPVVRTDWPAVHVSECFIDGEKASLRGPARPLRTYLPPTLTFRNPTDLDEELPETEVQAMQKQQAVEGGFELISSQEGVQVRKGKEMDMVPLTQYYYGRADGLGAYSEKKGTYRFLCCSCDAIMHNNVQFMFHILGHVDVNSLSRINSFDLNQCPTCLRVCNSPFDQYVHNEELHRRATINSLLQQQQLIGLSFDPTQTQLTGITWDCWICGQDFITEMQLAEHLHSQHKNHEMPYGCKLCGFRSSIYEDALDHFKKLHSDSSHVLCIYCLRIFPLVDESISLEDASIAPYFSNHDPTHIIDCNSQSVATFLNHLKLHQLTSQCRRCPACKLTFTNKNEYHIHRKLEHKASGAISTNASLLQPSSNQMNALPENTQPRALQTPRDRAASAPKREMDTYVKEAQDLSHLKVPEEIKELTCLECGQSMDTQDHKKYLPCSECRFASCCAHSFARHIRHSHAPTNTSWKAADDYRPFEKRVKLSLPSVTAEEPALAPVQASVVISGHDLVDLDADFSEDPNKNAMSIEEADEKRIDTGSYHCGTCGLSSMLGNRLAEHMVEVCGAVRAVLHPDEAIQKRIKARQEEEALAAEREKERSQHYVKLYADIPAEPAPSTSTQEPIIPLDEQPPQQQCFQIQTENGEIQTFMLPGDFQLKEGEALILVEGEDGQPQLAVVSQDVTEDQLVAQGEETTLFQDESQPHTYLI